MAEFDRTNPLSIYDYSKHLIGHSLRDVLGDDVIRKTRKGKGSLGQMVEELFFNYAINSNREADFKEANLELKCTPLLRLKNNDSFRIKERLVCTMIDYFEIVNTEFEETHLLSKCRLMLLLFYLHVSGTPVYDYEFLFRVLWELPEKDLMLIKKDYQVIADKVRRGEAHLLSEGDTLYLGACRKGNKGDNLQKQPFSDIKANKRAFSLKPAYMRYILNHVVESGQTDFTNYSKPAESMLELVNAEELKKSNFEDIIISRFKDFLGLNYIQICDKLGIEPYQAKSKYADVCGLIASQGKSKRLNNSEEFIKSGIMMKTIRLRFNGMPKEAMSFKNIDYAEVLENDNWIESELYEIFTNRFLFVVFKPVEGETITMRNNKTGSETSEQSYILDNVFFWTMPSKDLAYAKAYWEHIRNNVIANNMSLDSFWNISDRKKFHVRPKASKKIQLTDNPNGGKCEKFCYWLNADYVKEIIDNHK
ncbi:MAG: hypothetical protein HDS54_01630 [Barnesiella sp.]|nr:hypothetical protein [Barnesiella sp.]